MIKNNFRILKKTHAHLQTILKTPVKFQKDRTKTVGGVKGTKYLLKIWNHALRTTPHGKPKTVSLRFSSKRRGTIMIITHPFILAYTPLFPTPFAQVESDFFIPVVCLPIACNLSAIFSQTLGTPKTEVGLTSFQVLTKVP